MVKIAPRPSIAWLIGVLYAPASVALIAASGVKYADITASTANARSAIVIPLAILAVVLIIVTSVLGWWRPVLTEARNAPRWMIAIPAVVAVAVVVNVAYPKIGKLEPKFLIWITVAALLVGFCEEIAYRGLAVVGLRAGHSEARVWLYSTLMFGLLHVWNIFLGNTLVQGLLQFVITFLVGSVLYACRRATGTIIIPMLLHAGWDWTTFTRASTAWANPADTTSDGANIGMLLLLTAFVLFLIGARRLLATPTTPARHP